MTEGTVVADALCAFCQTGPNPEGQPWGTLIVKPIPLYEGRPPIDAHPGCAADFARDAHDAEAGDPEAAPEYDGPLPDAEWDDREDLEARTDRGELGAES